MEASPLTGHAGAPPCACVRVISTLALRSQRRANGPRCSPATCAPPAHPPPPLPDSLISFPFPSSSFCLPVYYGKCQLYTKWREQPSEPQSACRPASTVAWLILFHPCAQPCFSHPPSILKHISGVSLPASLFQCASLRQNFFVLFCIWVTSLLNFLKK